MEWRQISLWIPIPSLRISWRFSLRSVLLFVTIVAFSLLLYEPPRAATSVLTFPIAPAGATNTQAQIHAQTEAALLQSEFVILAAMRRNHVRELEVLRRQANPVQWIQSQLEVVLPKQPGSGAAKVTLTTREGNVDELKLIVDAIVDEYNRESTFAREKRRARRLGRG